MNFEFIHYHTEERIAYISLNRPEKRNALNAGMVEELHSAFLRAEDDISARVIILKAAGKAFSAGADLD
ncbi:MAG TPA: enoyl-CoA hydratase-related protein, partial [Anseongella sp.]|nr:enoyl-CoA hydratase-related protein [Anseongella sp.]